MIQSLYQIDMINPAGTHRLLDYGDVIADEIRFSVAQQAAQYSPIGSPWGETDADGNPYVSLSWTRRQSHASHAVARSQTLRMAAGTTTRQTGTLRVAVQGGETWDIADCTLTNTEPTAAVGYGFRTLTSYAALGGRMSPVSTLTLYAGIPWDWTLQQWQTVSNQWQTL